MTFRSNLLRAMIISTTMVGLSIASTGQAGPKGHTKPVAGESGKVTKVTKVKKIDDSWLGTVLLDELKRSVGDHDYSQLTEQTEKAILARLTCGHVDRLDTLSDMVYVLRACRYLALLETLEGGKELADWLVKHRVVARRMFRALQDVKSPEECLRKLGELVKARPKIVLKYPDLSVAFATSLPISVKYGRQPSRATMLEAFDWYTNPKVKFRYDLRVMPYEVSRYLACSRLSIKERQWAVAQYARLPNPAKSYFHLRYDFDSYRRGKPRKISKVPYTLPNLRRFGGVCIDQAYYATEVCRSLGIPATIVIGRSGVGSFHAWVAMLKISKDGRNVVWDSKTGRYKSLLFYTGTVYEPAALRKILDCELMLSCQAARLPLQRREQADAATFLAKMVITAGKETAQGDLSVLKRLADSYKQRFRSGKKKYKPAKTDWIEPSREIDVSLATDLISQAIERNFVYRPTWELIIKLCKDHLLPGSTVDKFLGVLVSRTAKDYPDYGCEMLLRIAPTIDDVKHRREIYRKAFDIYKRRPDLQGRILIAIGEDFERAGDKPAALRCYEQAAMRCINIAEIVLDAASHVEQMFREVRRTDLAIQFYGRLFSRTRKVRTAFPENTAHYQIGQRLAQLLKDAGDYRSAARVESQLR